MLAGTYNNQSHSHHQLTCRRRLSIIIIAIVTDRLLLLAMYIHHVSEKAMTPNFEKNSVKNEPILVIFGAQNP